jgi:hypothetical protein
VLGAEGRGIVSRIDGAIEFADKLLATNPIFNRANPGVAERLTKMKEHSRHYLAHEYFNRDWHPMHFATMAEWLEPAKVQWACSAAYLDAIDVANLTPEQQTFLAEIPDPMFRQSVRDFMVNQQFRKDYWVKGPRRLSALEQAEMLRNQRVILTIPRSDISLKVTGSAGEVTLSESVYNPILDCVADYKVRSIGEMEQTLKSKNVNFRQLIQAVVVLCGTGSLSAAQDEKGSSKSLKSAQSINNLLLRKARGSGDVGFLASPVTGGGVGVNRFTQLFLLSIQEGKKKPEEWAQSVWEILASQGQSIIKDGKTLQGAEENLAELTAQAKTFSEKQLPILKALGIA